MEACKWWGITLDIWKLKPVLDRARMMAHWLHRSMREGYAMEKRLEKMKDEAKGGGKGKGKGKQKSAEENDFHRLDAMLTVMAHSKKQNSSIEVINGGRKG